MTGMMLFGSFMNFNLKILRPIRREWPLDWTKTTAPLV